MRTKIFFITLALLLAVPSALAQGYWVFEYVSSILGIFIFLAFLVVTIVLHKYNLSIGPWILVAFATLFITASEFYLMVLENVKVHRFMLVVGFIMLFFAAIFKYWDVIELTQ